MKGRTGKGDVQVEVVKVVKVGGEGEDGEGQGESCGGTKPSQTHRELPQVASSFSGSALRTHTAWHSNLLPQHEGTVTHFSQKILRITNINY